MSAAEEEELAADVAEEYEVWKKNAHAMYTHVKEIVLEWPSLTVEWMPDSSDESTALVGSMMGEDAGQDEYQYVAIVAPSVGGKPSEFTRCKSSKDEAPVDEINRARVNTANPKQIASMAPSGDILIWKIEGEKIVRTRQLRGHKAGGYGISWRPTPASGQNEAEQSKHSLLLSGADDEWLILWNVDNGSEIWRREVGTRVNDVAWAPSGDICAAAGENGSVYIFNIEGEQMQEIKAHEKGVNALAWSPFTSNLLATASDDQEVALWDLRIPMDPMHVLRAHTQPVTSVKWSPHHDGVLATASPDRRVILWDLRRVGCEEQGDDFEDAAPELLFMHGGHTSPITDIDWHPSHPWELISVAEDNICQVWQPNRAALGQPEVPEVPKYLL